MSIGDEAGRGRVARWLSSRAIFVVLGLLLLVAALVSDAFLQLRYLFNMVRQISPIGIAAIGVTWVMILGGVDLSVGAVISLSAVLCAVIMDGSTANIVPAVLVACASGTAIGLLNGMAITFGRVSPFIQTLGMGVAVIGLTQMYSGGTARGTVAPGFREWLNIRWFGIAPGLALAFILLAMLGIVLQNRTVFGRYLYLAGSNPRAAYHSGLPVAPIAIAAYAISGFFGALGGIALLARSGVSSTSAGQGLEFQVLAAVVLGGTTFAGGRGGVGGTVAGVMVLVVAFNLVNMSGLPYHVQLIVMGLIIIGASAVYSRLGARG